MTGGRPRSDLGVRLRRVLLMIPWLLEEGGSTVAEISRRFGVDEKEVVRDLTLVMCCGVPPYGGGDLITVVLDDDGTVEAYPGPFFTRPMQLTAVEGFAVLAAGRALQAVPGTGQRAALASALEKLESALGASGAVAVDLEAPPLLSEVQDAVAGSERLRITYYSARRDVFSQRVIEPLVVHSRDGHWYVETNEVTDAGESTPRRFRIDRIRSAESTGDTFERLAPVAPPARLYEPDADAIDAVLVLPPRARWIVEAFEVEAVDELDDGRLRVRLWASAEAWLERLVVRAGPGVEVERPEALRDLPQRAARRVLARYQ